MNNERSTAGAQHHLFRDAARDSSQAADFRELQDAEGSFVSTELTMSASNAGYGGSGELPLSDCIVVREQIGSGSNSCVFACSCRNGGAEAALKVLVLATDALREQQALGALINSPFVVKLLGCKETNDGLLCL